MKTITNIFNPNWYFNCPNYRAVSPGKEFVFGMS